MELISTAECSATGCLCPPHSFSLVCSIGREPTLVVNTYCQVVPRLQFGSGQPGLVPVGLDCQKLSEGPSSPVDVSCLDQHHFRCGSWHALNICSPFPAVLRRLKAQPLEREFHAHSAKPRARKNLLGTQMPSISGAIQGDGMESWLQASPLRHWVQGCTRGSFTRCLYNSP